MTIEVAKFEIELWRFKKCFKNLTRPRSPAMVLHEIFEGRVEEEVQAPRRATANHSRYDALKLENEARFEKNTFYKKHFVPGLGRQFLCC